MEETIWWMMVRSRSFGPWYQIFFIHTMIYLAMPQRIPPWAVFEHLSALGAEFWDQLIPSGVVSCAPVVWLLRHTREGSRLAAYGRLDQRTVFAVRICTVGTPVWYMGMRRQYDLASDAKGLAGACQSTTLTQNENVWDRTRANSLEDAYAGKIWKYVTRTCMESFESGRRVRHWR